VATFYVALWLTFTLPLTVELQEAACDALQVKRNLDELGLIKNWIRDRKRMKHTGNLQDNYAEPRAYWLRGVVRH
jgi:hypothetical protein